MSEINLAELVAQCGVNFYDAEAANENGRSIWRVYITKNGGVSVDDCEAVSKLLSPIYDVMPPLGGEWILEVSSPGMERKLSKLDHFAKSVGESAKVTLSDEQKSTFIAKIVGVEGEKIKFENEEGEREISFGDIKKARTYVEW